MAIFLTILAVLVVSVCAMLLHPAFGRNPSGERLQRIMKSANYKDGSFHNQTTTPMLSSGKSRFQIIWENLTTKKPEDIMPDEPVEAIKTNLDTLNTEENVVVWFGHSSYLLINGGKRILVDPVLTSGFPASLMMKPFKGSDIYSPADMPAVDLLVITHDHYDHLDYGTVKALKNKIGKVICPLGVGEHFEYWGYDADRIVEMDWNDSITINNLKITCLPARHFSGRFLKENPTLWASFIIEGNKTVFVGGDSGYGPHFSEIGNKFPNIDLALLENGQYNENWKYIHTMPEQLPVEMHEVGAKLNIPVHNGKYALARHSWIEPRNEIENAAKKDSTLRIISPVIGKTIKY